jgi:hypothetical protein
VVVCVTQEVFSKIAKNIGKPPLATQEFVLEDVFEWRVGGVECGAQVEISKVLITLGITNHHSQLRIRWLRRLVELA